VISLSKKLVKWLWRFAVTVPAFPFEKNAVLQKISYFDFFWNIICLSHNYLTMLTLILIFLNSSVHKQQRGPKIH
jgi:hypothetical protein